MEPFESHFFELMWPSTLLTLCTQDPSTQGFKLKRLTMVLPLPWQFLKTRCGKMDVNNNGGLHSVKPRSLYSCGTW